eukprot:TRINITY_DN2218_c0_g1_i1.p2 TRINITY_DN2218_c0_g1~~TRINITY_DN2218_c0_g1_i1.p2  ORF type:complete len:182 (-),score=31.52 TRINITY_DN2218_c0_g1_i1:90-635(-)
MSENPRGIGVFIGNGDCHKDAEAMRDLFDGIGYKSLFCHDLNAPQITSIVQQAAGMTESSHDSFFLYYSGDDCVVEIETLVDYLGPKNCPNLNLKPKIILFDCCQGYAKMSSSDIKEDYDSCDEPEDTKEIMPSMNQDFLIYYSSSSGFPFKISDRQSTNEISVWTYFLMERIKKVEIRVI